MEPSKLSVNTFLLDHWLPAIKASLPDSTLKRYRGAIRTHVLPSREKLGSKRSPPRSSVSSRQR